MVRLLAYVIVKDMKKILLGNGCVQILKETFTDDPNRRYVLNFLTHSKNIQSPKIHSNETFRKT